MTLEEFFSENRRAALGFSGGTDSSYLLYAALRCGAQVQPYFIKTSFQPEFELQDAQRLCAQLGVALRVLHYDILTQKQVAENPKNRCYYCKTALFSLLKQQALEDGYTLLLDGTNASDDADDRPGMQALQELQVRSPLRLCGLSKQEIRRRSKEAGLFTWNKPAYACLATRVPTGEALTQQKLTRVEQAEQALFSLGFRDLRVRLFHGAARLQLPKAQMAAALSQREEILRALRPLFDVVLLDLEARS